MAKHVMLDLETMGTGTFSTILSIGAVAFDPYLTGVDDSFEVFIDPVDCQRVGLQMDWGTITWWMDKDQEVARELLLRNIKEKGHDLPTALGAFRDWLEPHVGAAIWGFGATFDNVLLRNAYKAIGEPAPWSWRSDRCFRTIVKLAPEIEKPSTGEVLHSALGDAITQAKWMQEIVAHLGLVL